MPEIYDLTRMTTPTAGVGTITLGVAVSGYLTFAAAGVPDGAKVIYGIRDGVNSEAGYGTYTAAGTTLSRDKILASTNGGSAISLSGGAEVYITMAAESLPQPLSSGLLVCTNTTTLTFQPFNGDRIKIAGLWYKIPSAGITGSNTGVFLNGVGASNLAASTVYYVYLFNNAGTLTFDYSTTGRVTDTTSGNVGTEIKSADNTRSLIGMVRVNASAQFTDNNGSRLTLSWFNRQNKDGLQSGASGTTPSTTASPNVLIGSAFPMLNWAGEAVYAVWNHEAVTTASFTNMTVSYDVVGNTIGSLQYIYNFANPIPTAVGGWGTPLEGYHVYGAYAGQSNAAGFTFTSNNGTISLMTRG
jgi:hypothetical protein